MKQSNFSVVARRLRQGYSVFMIASLLAFAGCNKGSGEEGGSITVSNQTALTQTVYADKTQGTSGVDFIAAGAWTSQITGTTRADSPAWITIDPPSGDKAGNYTINISMSINTTGAARSAKITINCGGDYIDINVTQQATTQSGTTPTQKLVSKIEDVSDDGKHYYTTFDYDSQNRITKQSTFYNSAVIYDEIITYTYTTTTITETDNDEVRTYTLNSDGYVASYTYPLLSANDGKGTVTYDNGYIVKDNWTNTGHTQGSTVNDYTTYTWSGGKLQSAKTYYYNGTQGGSLFTFQYGSVSNMVCNLDLTWLSADGEMLFACGFFGKRSPYLPSKITITEGDGKENGVTTVRYVTDSEGYVTEVYMKEDDSTETLWYKISYK